MLMKLTVLGCWAPYPRAAGACPGYLLQADGRNILLDCGNGVFSNLRKYIDFRRLDAVIVTHFHPDHYLDLYCLRHAVEGARRISPDLPPLRLYLPEAPAEPFQQLSRYPEAFNVQAVEKLPGLPGNGTEGYKLDLAGLKISFIRTNHSPQTFAVKMEGEGTLFYSADTGWCDYLPGFAAGAEVVLCEASLTEEDKASAAAGHLTAGQAGELARQAGAGQLIITHFWPEYDLARIRAQAESGFGRPVIVAEEGLEVEI